MLDKARKREKEYQKMTIEHENRIKQLMNEKNRYVDELTEKNNMIAQYQK